MPITITRELPAHKIGTGWTLPGIARIVRVDTKRVNSVLTLRDEKTTFEMTVRLDAVLTVEREVATTGERALEAYADLVMSIKSEVEDSHLALRIARERLETALSAGAHAADWSVMGELHRAIARAKVADQVAINIKDIDDDREVCRIVRSIVEGSVMAYTPEQSTSKVSNLMGEYTHVAWQRLRGMHSLEYVIRCEQALIEKGPDANATGW